MRKVRVIGRNNSVFLTFVAAYFYQNTIMENTLTLVTADIIGEIIRTLERWSADLEESA